MASYLGMQSMDPALGVLAMGGWQLPTCVSMMQSVWYGGYGDVC
jgi:hypothetical protein